MSNTFVPKTVEEFIDHYTIELKNDLKVHDIQINKVGFLGFLLNILGHTHFDIKNYYDFLFKESFIATSEISENIHLHASTYGYFPAFATASTIKGFLEVDFNLFPSRHSGVVKRELYINGNDELFTFESEGYTFTTKSVYKMSWENQQYKTTVLTEDGRMIQYPSSAAILTPPILDAKQYNQIEYNFKSSNYPANSFYTYYFSVEEGFIEDLKVFITQKGDIKEVEYDVKYVKFFETSSSESVFLRKMNQKDYVLELGSGLRGKWVPQADVRLLLNITKGDSGNFLKVADAKQSKPQQVTLVDMDTDGKILSSINMAAEQIIKVKIEESADGKNPLEDLELREAVIKYIQSRDNMVSELDFYNVADKYMSDFKFLFKKVQVYDNIFYLCRSLRDKFQNVIYSDNISVTQDVFEKDLYHPVFQIREIEMISPFLYRYNPVLNFYDGYLMYDDLFVYINSINLVNTIKPTFDVPPLYFNIIYNQELNETKIQVKSYQSIQHIEFRMEIPVIKITNQLLDSVDENTSQFIYKDDGGVIFDEIDILLNCYFDGIKVFTAQVNEIHQVYNITELLNLTHYVHNGINYIVNIPIIEKVKFDNEKKYFLEKLHDFIMGDSFKENRMISDHIQFRFLNSIHVKSPYLECSLRQGQNFLHQVQQTVNIVSAYINDPPELVKHNDSFLIDTDPTGEFLGHQNEIAQWIEVGEEVKIVCNAVEDIQNGNYFIIYNKDELGAGIKFCIFYVIDTYDVSDKPVLGDDFKYIVIKLISDGDYNDDDYVAYKTSQTLENSSFFSSTYYNNVVTITNQQTGNVNNIEDYGTNFSFNTVDGIDGHYEYQVPKELNVVQVVTESETLNYRFESGVWLPIGVNLPLKLFIEIMVDKQYVVEKNINLNDERDELIFKLADLLQKKYTGTNIVYYNSQIIDFVHLDRPYIKSTIVIVKDQTGLNIENGIEVLEDRQILENLGTNKFDIVRYTPVFWHWDVDDINVEIIIN